MRRFVTVLILAALALALLAGAAAAGPGRACAPAPTTIATFSPGDWGSFAEGMAADSHGNLYVSLTVWGYYDEDDRRVATSARCGRWCPVMIRSVCARADLSPYGMLLGVAVDRCDRVYVAAYDMESGLTPNGVYRLQGDGSLTQVVALPEGVWPNGMAFHDGRLYITDTALGAVWRVRLGCGVASPTAPWLQDDLLAPGDPTQDESVHGLGADGLAFRGDDLFVGVYDFGRIVRVHVRDNGVAGPARRRLRASRAPDGRRHGLRPRRRSVDHDQRRHHRREPQRCAVPSCARRPAHHARRRPRLAELPDDAGLREVPVTPACTCSSRTAPTTTGRTARRRTSSPARRHPGLPLW